MALSKQVEDTLRASQEYLRDALSFSARTEKPYVSKHIADMLANIDNLIDATELIEKLNERQEGDSGMFGTFFGDSKD